MAKNILTNAPLDHAHLSIDLSALIANYQSYVALTPTAQTAAVVKADAYGLGIDQIAPALSRAGCKTFFVAQAREGAQLRVILNQQNQAGDIYILNGYISGAADYYAQHILRPCLGSLEEINQWQAQGRTNPALHATLHPALHPALHIDTGFNRLGLSQNQIDQLPDSFTPSLLMSHLACADEPDHPMNQQQISMFQTNTEHFATIPACLANSAGTLLGQDYHFDMVRIGIGLYGGAPTKNGKTAGQCVASLQAPVLQLRHVKAGENIGYGATFMANNDMDIAILSIGYADGFPRRLGRDKYDKTPFAQVILEGQKCPLLGRISMDLLAVDISHVQANIERGQMAELFGTTIALETVAQQAKTISYELLTQLGTRYKRVYKNG